MATLHSKADGNWSSSSTWAVCNSTAAQDTDSNGTREALTTSWKRSASFTPGAITIDAIGVKLIRSPGVASQTMSVRLWNVTDGTAVTGTTVTVNTTDLPYTSYGYFDFGWQFFQFSSVTLTAGKAYAVEATVSANAANIELLRNATAANFDRQLRTTTTSAPSAGDKLIIGQEYTGAGTATTRTVTYDITATTNWGNVAWATQYLSAIEITKGGTVTVASTASTNFVMQWSGVLAIQNGGIFTNASMASTSTLEMYTNNTAAVDSGIIVLGGTLTLVGNALTYNWTRLNADLAASSSAVTTVDSTGWVSGDKIVIAKTNRTNTNQAELFTLTSGASGTSITLPSNTAYSHKGSGDMKAHVANLTRNVKLHGESSTLTTYITLIRGANVTLTNVELYNLGSNTATKRGIDTTTSQAGFMSYLTMNGCSVYNLATNSLASYSTNIYATTDISDCIYYSHASSAGYCIFQGPGADNYTIDNILAIETGIPVYLASLVGTCTNIYTSGSLGVFSILGGGAGVAPTYGGTFDNWELYGAVGTPISITAMGGINENYTTISNVYIWNSYSYAIQISGVLQNAILDTWTLKGNQQSSTVGQIYIQTVNAINALLRNWTVDSNADYTSYYGIIIGGQVSGEFVFENCDWGTTVGHANADIYAYPNWTPDGYVFLDNHFDSTTPFTGTANLGTNGLTFWKYDATANDHRTYQNTGILQTDTTIYRSSSISLRMTPNMSNEKLTSDTTWAGGWTVPVDAGDTATIQIYARKSASGDGTAYNGNQPRLRVRANYAAGITTDTTIATMSVGTGEWELLEGTTPTVDNDCVLYFYVDCDGTQGWVNVDDFEAPAYDTRDFKYWGRGIPYVVGNNVPGTVSYETVHTFS